MPISRSAKKSLRKSRSLKGTNVAFKKKIKVAVKEFTAKKNEETLKKLVSVLDKAVKKNIFHRNKVARLKSRYAKKLKMKGEKIAAVVAKKKKVVKKTKVKKSMK